MKRFIAIACLLAACGSDDAQPAADETGGSATTATTGNTASPGTTGNADTEGSQTDPVAETETDPTTQTGSESSTTAGESSSSTGDPQRPRPTPWTWDLPPSFPNPEIPKGNPMTVEKVDLGRHLFYDTRLSVDGTYSCATCHRQELAFTDGLGQAEGATGQVHPRGSMSLANVAYAATLAWGNPMLLDLESHAVGPMFGTEPVELGLVDEADVVSKLSGEPRYDELFAAAYPEDEEPMTLVHVVEAIASFERILISSDAPFDRWFYEGEEDAVSDAAKRGWDVFNFPGECTYCHFSFNYTDSTYFESVGDRPMEFHNTGLYNTDGEGAYPTGNEGLFNFTGLPEDMGRFKSPTLRNIAVTGPYMHDGSVETLDGMLDHYATGGRVETPHADFGMTTFELTPDERADLLAFLESLTDDGFLTNPAYANPW